MAVRLPKELVKKYPKIVAWGKMLKSSNYYIKEQLLLAEKLNAPTDAIYYSDTRGKFIRLSSLSEETQALL